jgi:hypothetical protein
LLFRSGKRLRDALAKAQIDFSSNTAKILLDFVTGAKRGVCADVGRATAESEEE